MPASDVDRRRVWVLSGGRCLLCHEYLLTDDLEDLSEVRHIGEVAHIAGESTAGPRGESEVPEEERNDLSNLVLLCPNHHRSADKRRLTDPIYTEEFLLARKREWEAFIKAATGILPDHRTMVLRMVDTVKVNPAIVSISDVAKAVMGHSLRMPRYLGDLPAAGPDIDLNRVPETIDEQYWTASLAQIDAGIMRFRLAMERNVLDHLSVFAIAHVPLLVALGNRLDDAVPTDIFNKQRSSESWTWDQRAQEVPFTFELADADADEAVLLVNASGSIFEHELPEAVAGLPVFRIRPAEGHDPTTSTFDSAGTQAMFDAAVRSFFAELELREKHVRRLHVFAAVPVSAAVALGRRLPADVAAPRLALYHRTDNTYLYAFDIPG